MSSELNLNQLKAFYLAATCGSISRAAEKLFISQPAVSMQIKALEEQYSVQLFIRRKKRLELTEPGKELFQRAEKIFAIVASAERLLAHYAEPGQDVLRIGSTKTLVRYFLRGYISRFQQSFPNIHIEINEGSSEEIVQSVLDQRSDIAIVGIVAYDAKLKVIPFSQDEIVLLAAPGHRLNGNRVISIKDLKGEHLIFREKGSGVRKAVDGLLAAAGIAPPVLIETGNVDFIKEMVQIGNGITLLASMGVDADVKAGRLAAVRLKESPIFLDIDLVVSKERTLSKAEQAFLDLLMENRLQK